jgi:predicted RNA-binding protein YlxR (DUF448 family)
MAKGKIPLRTCIACKEMKPKKEMLRIVKTADGEIFPDPTGKAAGRGAYICENEKCRQLLGAKKLLNKAFSAPVGAEVYERIEGENKN